MTRIEDSSGVAPLQPLQPRSETTQASIARALAGVGQKWEPPSLAGRVTAPSTQPGLVMVGVGIAMTLGALLYTAMKLAPAPLSGHLAPGGVKGAAEPVGGMMVPAVIGAALMGAGIAEYRRVRGLLTPQEQREKVQIARQQISFFSNSWFITSHASFVHLQSIFPTLSNAGDTPHGRLAAVNQLLLSNPPKSPDRDLLEAVQLGLAAQVAAEVPVSPLPTRTKALLGGGLLISLAALAAIAAQLISLGTDSTALSHLSERDALFLSSGLAAGGILGAALFGAGLAKLHSHGVKDPQAMSGDELEQELDFLYTRLNELVAEMSQTVRGAEALLRAAHSDLKVYPPSPARRLEALNTLLESDKPLTPDERTLAKQVQLCLAAGIGPRLSTLNDTLNDQGLLNITQRQNAPDNKEAQEYLHLSALFAKATGN
jgi:hypothetical protein